MVSLFLLLGCNLSYIVDLFAALHELASASARTLLKLTSLVHALLKPYGDTLNARVKYCRKTSSTCTNLWNCYGQKSQQGLLKSQLMFPYSYNPGNVHTILFRTPYNIVITFACSDWSKTHVLSHITSIYSNYSK